MSNYFTKKDYDKMNYGKKSFLSNAYIVKLFEWNLYKSNRGNYKIVFPRGTSQQRRVSCYSLRKWSSCKKGVVLVWFFVNQSWVCSLCSTLRSIKAKGRKRLSGDGIYGQVKILSINFKVFWYLLVSLSCAPTIESIYFSNSFVPWHFGVVETRAKWLYKNSSPWDKQKSQAGRGISWKHILISRTTTFTVRMIESGLKSRDYWAPSLETEKLMVLDCRLNMYKIDQKRNFGLLYQPTRNRYNYAIHRVTLAANWSRFGCGWLWLAKILPWEGGRILCFATTTCLFGNAICTASTKWSHCQFLFFKGNIKHVTVSFALSAVVEIFFSKTQSVEM